jgi:serine/threonine protein kinase
VKDLVLLEELKKLLLRRYFRDVIAGLMYLHSHNIVHGDIKPENLLIDSNGRTKFCDFSVSRSFEDDNDELRRSPGTRVFIATERCLGLTYQEKTLACGPDKTADNSHEIHAGDYSVFRTINKEPTEGIQKNLLTYQLDHR